MKSESSKLLDMFAISDRFELSYTLHRLDFPHKIYSQGGVMPGHVLPYEILSQRDKNPLMSNILKPTCFFQTP